jgi:hypothetical protein
VAALYCNYTEFIDANYQLTVKGNRQETLQSDQKLTVVGKTNETFIGIHNRTNIAPSNHTYVHTLTHQHSQPSHVNQPTTYQRRENNVLEYFQEHFEHAWFKIGIVGLNIDTTALLKLQWASIYLCRIRLSATKIRQRSIWKPSRFPSRSKGLCQRLTGSR